MSIAAMKQALEALETATHQWEKEDAIASLRQAIAEFDSHTLYREGYVNGYAFGEAAGKRQAIEQTEKQEPAVWVRTNGINNSGVAHYGPTCPPGWVAAAKPYYDTPQPQRPWVSLTDAEIEEFDYYARDLVMDIEKALKERNT